MTWIVIGGLLVLVTLYDLTQRRHAILRNFPVVGHLRYLLETVGPELRQYIVTSNDEERPFSRDQRTWIYTSSKGRNNAQGFGTDNELELAPNYLIVKHRAFPAADIAAIDPEQSLPCAKVLGGARRRRQAFRPDSIVNVSGMSFGSLSGPAVEALNRGAALARCLQNTGEGGISPHHLHGGELIWQIGTGYFGCRDEAGNFSIERFRDTVQRHPVRAIEVKLSQGAKPGQGGLLPAAKVSPEIAAARGIPVGVTCRSPARHSAFGDVDGMLDFVEGLADASGLPVGIKSAVGEHAFWRELASAMARGDRGVDFITIDGGEGGTGAAPLVFADHVALPFKQAMTRVYTEFAEQGLTERVVFVGSAKLGFPETAIVALALGCDMIHVAREAMMSIGCIQAQRCHTGHCPTGIATQNRWLVRGVDPTHKAERLASYIKTLRREILALSRACGAAHPALVTLDDLEFLDGRFGSLEGHQLFGYEPGWGQPGADDRQAIEAIMRGAPPGDAAATPSRPAARGRPGAAASAGARQESA